MFGRENISAESKFTRGEKCLFIHLIITFLLIIVLVIVFFIHLCLVEHRGKEIFKITQRRSSAMRPIGRKVGYVGLGVVYLNTTPVQVICNSLLVRARWSLAPGHCVSIRSEPDIAQMLPAWKIRYRMNTYKNLETDIERSVIHPHFDKDDFNNNIGLFEHNEIIIPWFEYPLIAINNETFVTNANNYMEIATWELTPSFQNDNYRSIIMRSNIVKHMPIEQCRQVLLPIVKLRENEFCVTIGRKSNSVIAIGAIVFINAKVSGFFSWGHKQAREEPIVILNISSFKVWLQFVIYQ